VFGKKDNTDAIELSAIAAGTGGFVINGESARDYSGYSVSNAGDVTAMSDNSMASVLSFLPNTTYDLPACDLPLGSACLAPIIKSSKPDLIVGAYGADDPDGKSHQGKSYVVFGKKDNTNAIELSDIAAGIGGFR
jgi:hypothetical protein